MALAPSGRPPNHHSAKITADAKSAKDGGQESMADKKVLTAE
jgi:hypothetical protein